MPIREAQKPDIPRIVEMGSRSLLEGPYRELLADQPKVTAKLAQKLLDMPNAKILVAEEDEQLVGVFCFLLFDHYYSGEKVAGEMIWYVEPEARTGRPIALRLLWAAEKLAQELGAKKMQLTAPTEEIAQMYQRLKGYVKVETSFQRELRCPSPLV